MLQGALPKHPGHKVQEQKIESLLYKVHPAVPIPESSKIVLKILDEVFNERLGFHFLEPLKEEIVIRKVVPQLNRRF